MSARSIQEMKQWLTEFERLMLECPGQSIPIKDLSPISMQAKPVRINYIEIPFTPEHSRD